MVPWGLCVAETDQSSSSEDKSIKSRQSETALERRESSKPEPPNSERIEITSCNTSTTVFTVPANSEGETFNNSDPTVLGGAAAEAEQSKDKKKMSVIMGVSVIVIWGHNHFVEESAIEEITLLCNSFRGLAYLKREKGNK